MPITIRDRRLERIMKDYIQIKINKNTLIFLTKAFLIAFLIFGLWCFGSLCYNSIKDSGYEDGFEDGKIAVINYTINAIREDGYGYVGLNGEYENFYEYSDPCDPRPEYCDMDNIFLTGNVSFTWDDANLGDKE